jgi:hypothetical protein
MTVCNLYPDLPKLDAAYLLMSLVFNSFVFAATLFYTFKALKSSNPKHLVQTVRRDGIFYFFVVFSSHLILFICIQYGRVRGFVCWLCSVLTCDPACDQGIICRVSSGFLLL